MSSAKALDVVDFPALWALATRQFALGLNSDHGPDHWQRVERNATQIVERAGAGDLLVVRLFAVLHDSQRRNERHDPQHGSRAAAFACKIRGIQFDLDRVRFDLLCDAMTRHDRGKTTDDPTIGACWDADRLDLGRVGIEPAGRFFSTQAGRAILAERHRRGRR